MTTLLFSDINQVVRRAITKYYKGKGFKDTLISKLTFDFKYIRHASITPSYDIIIKFKEVPITICMVRGLKDILFTPVSNLPIIWLKGIK